MKFNPDIHKRKSIRLQGYDYSKAGLYFITICVQNRECRFGKIAVGANPCGCPEMILNEYGTIAYNQWQKLTERFLNFDLDIFQIMPNHIHGIIVLHDRVGAGFTPAQNNNEQNNDEQNTPAQNNNEQNNDAQNNDAQNTPAQNNDEQPTLQPGQPHFRQPQPGQPQGIAPTGNATIGDIVGAYKSLVANGCLEIYKSKNETMGKLWQRNYYEHIIRNQQAYENISNYILNNPSKWQEDKFYNA